MEHGITTATFHIQTPYPGTRLCAQMQSAGRIVTSDWNLYDTRHVVYRPARLQPEVLKAGYDWAYEEFYRWGSIARASLHHGTLKHQAKHFFYASGWKKFEPLWDLMIRARQLRQVTPLLETVLSRVTRRDTATETEQISTDSTAIFAICGSLAAPSHADAVVLPLGSPPNPSPDTKSR
jgi:hypothetical protein